MPENLKFVEYVQDLIAIPEGSAIWKERGLDIKLTFELSKSSLCSKLLDVYLKKKGVVLWD